MTSKEVDDPVEVFQNTEVFYMIVAPALENFDVFLFESQNDQLRSFKSYLTVAGAHVVSVLISDFMLEPLLFLPSGETQKSFIFLELSSSEDFSSLEAAKLLRTHGFKNPIVGLVSDVTLNLKLCAQSYGLTDCIVKPSYPELADIILQLNKNAPAFFESEFKDNEVVMLVLPNFISGLSQRFSTLLTAYNASDWDKVAFTAHALRGTAANFGYPKITKLCSEIESTAKEKQIASSESIQSLSEFVGQALVGYAHTCSAVHVI